MSDPILELRGIKKSYGSVVAVDGVSVSLAAGEFLSFLGPSGSGKTTTLAMIAGLTQPSDGQILLAGKPINPLPPYRRNIGVVFQNYALFPHMTVAKNVAFPLEMRRLPATDIAAQVERVLSLVGLSNYGPRLPHQLSGGQQQRVALARAMVFEPPLLLMDEPLGALDKKLREQMQLEIKHLHQRLGMSIIYVTHDQEEALTMSDRIAVFNNGQIEQIGTPTDLYDRPTTRFVASFIGETNLFHGVVVEVDGSYCRIEGNGVQLRARHGGQLTLRQSMSVAVRPERTRLSSMEHSRADGANWLAGEVVELIYLGRFRKYVVRAAGSDVYVIQQIVGGDDPVFQPGQAVCLSWQAEDAVAISGLP